MLLLFGQNLGMFGSSSGPVLFSTLTACTSMGVGF